MNYCRVELMTRKFSSRGDAIDPGALLSVPMHESATGDRLHANSCRSGVTTFVGSETPHRTPGNASLLSADNVTLPSYQSADTATTQDSRRIASQPWTPLRVPPYATP
jgi:hypothetical protein